MSPSLLPESWNPKAAGDQLLARLVTITQPHVKGAHDSDFVIANGKAYVVYMANDVQPGEAAAWPFVYCALTTIDLATGHISHAQTFAASQKVYQNTTLPVGACFVPRIIQKDAATLRCFFASEQPTKRQSQTWYIDYDLTRDAFIWQLHQVEIQTQHGIFPMQPQHLYNHLATNGFARESVDFGLYMIDGFKRFDDNVYCVLNNYPGGQVAWAQLNKEMTRVTILGDFNLPADAKLTESAVNRIPDGSLLAITRQENRDRRPMFSTSTDGRTWSEHTYSDCVPDGRASKTILEHINGTYYMGWNADQPADRPSRAIFNFAVSRDGKHWEIKYHIDTDNTFQYASVHATDKAIYLAVTQGKEGNLAAGGKERILFGKLEDL